MSNYEQLKKDYGKLPVDERMQILRHEILRPISLVRGYSNVLNDLVVSKKLDSSKEVEEYISNIRQAGDDLLVIVRALTIVE